ncbi:SitI3 family protein [Micromonospora matsumotoense]|uniref:SitI3 family protein n=1 Tax=Micromonospora matsumotoense TaxID=121616 RepID=UPI003D917814
MLATVAMILAGTTEDAALTLNGDVLMLTRLAGTTQLPHTDGWYDETYETVLPADAITRATPRAPGACWRDAAR